MGLRAEPSPQALATHAKQTLLSDRCACELKGDTSVTSRDLRCTCHFPEDTYGPQPGSSEDACEFSASAWLPVKETQSLFINHPVGSAFTTFRTGLQTFSVYRVIA